MTTIQTNSNCYLLAIAVGIATARRPGAIGTAATAGRTATTVCTTIDRSGITTTERCSAANSAATAACSAVDTCLQPNLALIKLLI